MRPVRGFLAAALGAVLLAGCAGTAGPDAHPLPSGLRVGTLAILPLATESVTYTKYGLVAFANDEVVRTVPEWGLAERFRSAVERALGNRGVRLIPILLPPEAGNPPSAEAARPLLRKALAADPPDAVLVLEPEAGAVDPVLQGPDLHGCGLFYRSGLLSPVVTPFCRYQAVVLDGKTLAEIGRAPVWDSALREEIRAVNGPDRGYGPGFESALAPAHAQLLRADIEALIDRSIPPALAEIGLLPPAAGAQR
ncbi:hypothetical protein [Arenibaculum pallidiluteum]|uniref:hypothetical protein n=1 Tax=Arenibaculum pallidiluteum TaxID=2812559 RepID=UPI001A95BE32|nr:hypothetical protein [Arenibaculum pallidiluteum]